jgi:hypothetical protein
VEFRRAGGDPHGIRARHARWVWPRGIAGALGVDLDYLFSVIPRCGSRKARGGKSVAIGNWDGWQRWLGPGWRGKCGETYMCESLGDRRGVVCGFM